MGLKLKVISTCRGRVEKKRGKNMKDSLAMSLKTNGGKMSIYSSLAMLMKIKHVRVASRDVDEKHSG